MLVAIGAGCLVFLVCCIYFIYCCTCLRAKKIKEGRLKRDRTERRLKVLEVKRKKREAFLAAQRGGNRAPIVGPEMEMEAMGGFDADEGQGHAMQPVRRVTMGNRGIPVGSSSGSRQPPPPSGAPPKKQRKGNLQRVQSGSLSRSHDEDVALPAFSSTGGPTTAAEQPLRGPAGHLEAEIELAEEGTHEVL